MAKKTYIDKNGYPRFRDSGKLVHRWAYEKKKGRKIKKGNVIHHKDSNKLNSDESNLVELTRSKHGKVHAKTRRKKKGTGHGGLGKAILKIFGF